MFEKKLPVKKQHKKSEEHNKFVSFFLLIISSDEKPSVESAVAPLARTAKVFLAIIFIAAGALFSMLIGVL